MRLYKNLKSLLIQKHTGYGSFYDAVMIMAWMLLVLVTVWPPATIKAFMTSIKTSEWGWMCYTLAVGSVQAFIITYLLMWILT